MDVFIPPISTPPELMPKDFLWMFELNLTYRNNVPGISGTIQNAVAILNHDPYLKGRIRFNQFSLMIEKHELPWGGMAKAWDDHDFAQLKRHLEFYRRSGFPKDKVKDAIDIVAHEHGYHPVKDYLDNLEWDMQPRLETLFVTQLKTADKDIYRKASVCFAVKAVQRIYEPGCDLQFMPVFIGKQGCGKSSMARILGGAWMSDSAIAVGQKDGYMALQGKWIIEIAEMDSFRGKETQAVKSFISSQSDYFRPPYGQTYIDVKRQCIFFGTTNDTLCLSDSTGNRRFWPIECGADETDVQERILQLKAVRDQIWAEAVWLYKHALKDVDGLLVEVNKCMEEYQERHNEIDPMEYEIDEFLNTPLPSDWDKQSTDQRHQWYRGGEAYRTDYYKSHLLSHDTDRPRIRVTFKEFASEYLGMETARSTYLPMSKRFYRIMNTFEEWKRDNQLHRNGAGRAQITYIRINEASVINTFKHIDNQSLPPLPFEQSGMTDLPF